MRRAWLAVAFGVIVMAHVADERDNPWLAVPPDMTARDLSNRAPVFRAMGTNAIPFLLRGIASPDAGNRFVAARAFGMLRPEDSRVALPALSRLTNSTDENTRRTALKAMSLVKR
jgi:HEAT repeat protein